MESFFNFKMKADEDYPWYYKPISFNDMVIKDWLKFLTDLQHMCLHIEYTTVGEHKEQMHILDKAGREFNMSKGYYFSDKMPREQMYDMCYSFMVDFWDTIAKNKNKELLNAIYGTEAFKSRNGGEE